MIALVEGRRSRDAGRTGTDHRDASATGRAAPAGAATIGAPGRQRSGKGAAEQHGATLEETTSGDLRFEPGTNA